MSSLVAAASSSGGSGNLLIFALPLLLIGWMFYTQRRRTKESQRLQSTLGVGDEVTTTSGLLGRITALDGEIATLEVSPGVAIRFNRRAIAGPAPTAPVPPIASATNESETDAASDPIRETD
ncbi:MAG TPA: preprotein translocase subunit YajC [Dermatophilaceae bacterium]|nr:preprotein translocase subunit YajC [Dermatophilaceae bacterium]